MTGVKHVSPSNRRRLTLQRVISGLIQPARQRLPDEWQFFQSEELRQGLSDALQWLVGWDVCKETMARIEYARRWLARPAARASPQAAMQPYAWDGEQAAAPPVPGTRPACGKRNRSRARSETTALYGDCTRQLLAPETTLFIQNHRTWRRNRRRPSAVADVQRTACCLFKSQTVGRCTGRVCRLVEEELLSSDPDLSWRNGQDALALECGLFTKYVSRWGSILYRSPHSTSREVLPAIIQALDPPSMAALIPRHNC
jgi:hypothetical protein